MVKPKKKYVCHYCKDSGIIITNNGNTIDTCIYCANSQRFMDALTLAIKKAKNKSNVPLSKDLTSVKSFLPQFPVMAYLEAQARHMNDDFLDLLRTTFNILPLR